MTPVLQLAGLVQHQARYRPDRTAVVFESERLTWREFAARVCENQHGDLVAEADGKMLVANRAGK